MHGKSFIVEVHIHFVDQNKGIRLHNRPFPNCLVPLFQSEASCKPFHMKMRFICM